MDVINMKMIMKINVWCHNDIINMKMIMKMIMKINVWCHNGYYKHENDLNDALFFCNHIMLLIGGGR